MHRIATIAIALLLVRTASAGPWIDPGDAALRHDIQVLADAGVIPGPVSTWPLATADLVSAVSSVPAGLTQVEQAALGRLRSKLRQAREVGTVQFLGHASAAEHPQKIRSFQDQPREDGEVGLGFDWTGERYAVRLQGQWVNDPEDGKKWRADGSYLGVALGNWMLAASTSERYWGPGWQSSLILSNNARPVPAFTLERNLTTPFETRWLSWLGPWDLAVLWGYLDDDRAIHDARVFSWRFNFRPLKSLEVGASVMGLWCGSGQDCGLDELGDMLTGSGGSGPPEESEFDRLGGFDLRWSSRVLGTPFALYTHLIGEDFGDGSGRKVFPSKLLGQFGAETWGYHDGLGSYRFFMEWADSECDFSLYRNVTGDGGGGLPGCAYRNGKYRSGETYRGRSIAHSFDQDSSIYTLGGILNDVDDHSWYGTVAFGNINRRGANLSTVATNKTSYQAVQLIHSRPFGPLALGLGIGFEHRDDKVTNQTDDDVQAFMELRFPR